MSKNDVENEPESKAAGEVDNETEPKAAGEGAVETTEADVEQTEAPEADAPEAEARPTAAEAPAAAAPAPVAAKTKTSTAELTPGQRVAAARAAKAAAKTAKRGRDAEEREQSAIDAAELARANAAAYVGSHRMFVWGGLAAVLIIGSAILGIRYYLTSQSEAAGALLIEATKIQLTPVGGEATGTDGAKPFDTVEARANAALEKYDAILEDYARTDTAVWAELGRGQALLATGKIGPAREAYKAAAAKADEGSDVTRQALEGLGVTYEAEQKWDEALATYEELSKADKGVFESWGEYHAARVLLAKGNEAEAKDRLSSLVLRLQSEPTPATTYLLMEAQERLALLDPAAANAMPAQGDIEGLGDLTPERIQELLRRAQQEQQGQAGE